ncbi:MAG: ABC transporter ATP-binding protein [Planctomycetota bacterium]
MGPVVVEALRGIDLAIEEGGYYAIMGPSGSGKSTLLNLLGCLDRPTAGVYRLGGEDVSRMGDDQLSEVRGQRIGFVFQSFNLISQLSVLENIEVPLFYQGVAPRKSEEKARELARLVGLSDRLHHRPTELSGGQQQRVAIARALVNDPLIVLADEPTGNLDSTTSKEILNLIDDLNRSGMTIIVVTHDDHVADRAQTVIRMRDGVIESLEPSRRSEVVP